MLFWRKRSIEPASDERSSRPKRERLAETRKSITHKFRVGQLEGYLTVGLFDDGRPGEVFIKIAKHGSTVSGLVDTIAVLTSLALQYGVPVESLARKFEFTKFDPSGMTQHSDIPEAQSLVDYIFRWLGLEFSEEYRRECLEKTGNISQDSGIDPPVSEEAAEDATEAV